LKKLELNIKENTLLLEAKEKELDELKEKRKSENLIKNQDITNIK